jgi:hypothetical protein
MVPAKMRPERLAFNRRLANRASRILAEFVARRRRYPGAMSEVE